MHQFPISLLASIFHKQPRLDISNSAKIDVFHYSLGIDHNMKWKSALEEKRDILNLCSP